MKTFFVRVALVLIGTASIPGVALAWNEHGHRTIASIAYRQLTSNQRSAVISVLKKHPRFTADFQQPMPQAVKNGSEADQQEWLFQQAAVWPDMVKSGPAARTKFNRKIWHFINKPHFLNNDDRDELLDGLDVNLKLNPPANDIDDPSMNAIQAIKNTKKVLASSTQSAATKAVHICWALHLVGDIHQPMHASAIFTPNLFPTGDRGGNSIKTTPLKNLHAAWDQMLGKDDDFKPCRDHAVALLGRDDLADELNDAVHQMSVDAWLDESYALGGQFAYSSEIRAEIKSREAADAGFPPISLGPDYLKQAAAISDTVAVKAGARCAGVLASLSSSPSGALFADSTESPRPVVAAARVARRQPAVAVPAAAGTGDSELRDEIERLRNQVERLTDVVEKLTKRLNSTDQ